MMSRLQIVAATMTLCWAANAAAATPADKCQASKLKASGKKALCRLTEDAKAVLGKTADLTKCSTKFSEKFTAAETTGGAECPTTGDTAAIEARIDAATDGIVQALAGVRFVDNGNGTVTDTMTGLRWEKKVAGSGCTHCVDDQYTFASAMGDWISSVNGYSSDGATQTGLAGHSDWRVANIVELQTILAAPFGCTPSPCIDPVFGPTFEGLYLSSTTDASDPSNMWIASFFNGFVSTTSKAGTPFEKVRAVRGPD